MDWQCRESEGKVKIEGYMSVSDEEAHHRYHVGDLPYDLQTTSLHFPFLVSSLLPDTSFRCPTDHRLSHHVIGTLPYVLPHTNLVLVSLIVCI